MDLVAAERNLFTILFCLMGNGAHAIGVSFSGIAAESLKGGDSTFKILTPIKDHSTYRISKQCNIANNINKASLIVWDDAPMTIVALSRNFYDIFNDSRQFGDKVVVLGGDFPRILTVVIKGGEEDIVNVTLNRSILWQREKILRLP